MPGAITCRECGDVFGPGHYKARTLSADGSTAWCIPCCQAKTAAYSARSRAKMKAAGKKPKPYVPPDPEHHRELSRRRSLKYARNNAHKRREYSLRANFGLSPAAFDEMVERQGSACALCRTPFTKDKMVDHDHACCPGKRTCGQCIRGILCRKCNQGLGMLNEDVNLILRAAQYLISRRDALDLG